MKLKSLLEEAGVKDYQHFGNSFRLRLCPDPLEDEQNDPPTAIRGVKQLTQKLEPIEIMTTSKELMLRWLKFDTATQYRLAAAIWMNLHNGTRIHPLEITEDNRTWIASKVEGEDGVVIHIS